MHAEIKTIKFLIIYNFLLIFKQTYFTRKKKNHLKAGKEQTSSEENGTEISVDLTNRSQLPCVSSEIGRNCQLGVYKAIYFGSTFVFTLGKTPR